MEIPYAHPGEEPFQAQAERRMVSRGGGETTRYKRQGLTEPEKEKQIRWHHGAAAFVLKYQNDSRP